jgi:hypothetical protein
MVLGQFGKRSEHAIASPALRVVFAMRPWAPIALDARVPRSRDWRLLSQELSEVW